MKKVMVLGGVCFYSSLFYFVSLFTFSSDYIDSFVVVGKASGIIVSKGEDNYVITCGHIIESRKEKNKINVSHINIQNNVEVSREEFIADVLDYSPSEENGGLDIAILQLKKKGKISPKVKWSKDAYLGQDIYHVGNLWGENPRCLVIGKICKLDSIIKFNDIENSFYTCSLNARPGSSGGPVFIKDFYGNYLFCGIVCRSDMKGITFVKPVSVIREWLKERDFVFEE